MDIAPAIDPKSTLKENFLRAKQSATNKPATAGLTPGYTPPVDPLYKRLRCDVLVTFVSGRTLSGKLVTLTKFDIGIENAEGCHHIPKHAIEQVLLEPEVRP